MTSYRESNCQLQINLRELCEYAIVQKTVYNKQLIICFPIYSLFICEAWNKRISRSPFSVDKKCFVILDFSFHLRKFKGFGKFSFVLYLCEYKACQFLTSYWKSINLPIENQFERILLFAILQETVDINQLITRFPIY